VHFDVYRDVVSQAKVQAGITAGIKTTLTENTLSLDFSAIMHENAGPDRAAVGLYALELHLNPIWFSLNVIAQQRRWFVQVDDENVDVAIVIEIAKGTSPAAVGCGNARASHFDELLKSLIAEIAKNHARRLVGILRELTFNFGVNVTCNYKKVGVPIVIEIDDTGAPANVPGLDADASPPGHIVEVALAIVAI
jgi:hypothetical protein